MPTYLDRHDAPGATAQAVADAHLLDLAIQEKFGVHYTTYWFDENQGTIFCLAEGPSREAIEDVHREGHGMLATSILELDGNVPLNAFLGEIPTHSPGTAYVAPGMRAIVFTDVSGSVAQTQELGDQGHMTLLAEHNVIVREALSSHDGHEVKHTGDGIMASFSSVAASVEFAIAVQRRIHERNQMSDLPFHVSIGISAGEPITDDNDDLFGTAVQLAARLCGAASADDIIVSLGVHELCMGKQFAFQDGGTRELKGFAEPTPVYVVTWSAS